MHRDLKRVSKGFTLAAVLVVMAAMLLLAVGVLAVVGIERKTARSYVEAKRAEWAARAGMEEFRGLLREQTANDDFLVLAKKPALSPDEAENPDAPDHLFLTRGRAVNEGVAYDFFPMFSAATRVEEVTNLDELPDPGDFVGADVTDLQVPRVPLPAEVAWIPVINDDDETVARYAWWVEDLQGKLDARTAGNGDGPSGQHQRAAYPFPAAGVNPEPEGPGEPDLKGVALHVLDPDSGDKDTTDLDDRLRQGRDLLLSPDSLLAAAGFEDAPDRDEAGRATDPLAAVLEESVSASIKHYTESPTVPFSPGLSPTVMGRPKLNLNRMLGMERAEAVNEFAAWVNEALPRFKERAGGLPTTEDYVKTLAAGAFDYADEDNDPTIGPGYRGLDGYPLMSEIFLRIHFHGLELGDTRKYLNFTKQLYVEYWNMTNVPVSGDARVSYENGLGMSGIGAIPQGRRFDDEQLLLNPDRSSHSLTQMEGRFWSPDVSVSLRPDEYKTYKMAEVVYRIDVGPRSGTGSQFIESFSLTEPIPGSAGIWMRWNGQVVDRNDKLVRQSDNLGFRANNTGGVEKVAVEAQVPGHSYGPYGTFVNNMGDPRAAYYLRNTPLGENNYPGNASPNRRNVRRETIYNRDNSKSKGVHYGRVLPSEWPDLGHDSPVGSWPNSGGTAVEPTAMIGNVPTPEKENAPVRLSNAGRFYSATELGRVFDPFLWTHAYPDLPGKPGSGRADTRILVAPSGARMPPNRDTWPEVSYGSLASPDYGGGSTLRVGRMEHQRFDTPDLSAARLLDIFHVGRPRSENQTLREGGEILVEGAVNLNTASRDALRALAVGILGQDPKISRIIREDHRPAPFMSRQVAPIELGTPTDTLAADRVADAIIQNRPIDSAYALASIRYRERDGQPQAERIPVFGERTFYPGIGTRIQWNDSAAEELFARVYEASTLRSRNFRVWVIGQALAPRRPNSSGAPVVLAESRKAFTIFADPGERDPDGVIQINNYRPTIENENDF